MADERLGIILEAVDNASKTLQAVAKELKNLDAQAAKPGKTINELGSSLSSIGGSLRAAAGETAILSTALGVLGISAIKNAGKFEQYRVAFEVFLGSAENARTLLGDLSDFAAKTPFTLPEVVTGAKQLLAYGFAQEEVIDTMRRLGDVAAGLGLPISDLAFVFGTLKTQGRAFSRDIIQFTLRGIPILDALAETLGKTKTEINEMVSAGEIGFFEVNQALKLLTDEGGKFGGIMEKTSKTFLGTVTNILDNLIRIGNALVGITPEGDIIEGSLIDVLSDYAEKAKVFLDGLVETVINMDPLLRNIILGFVAFGIALAPVLFALSSIVSIGGAVITTLTGLATAVAGGTLFAGAGASVAAFGAALVTLAPYLLAAVVGVGALVAAWKAAKEVFRDPVLDALNEQIKATLDAEEAAAESRLEIKQEEYDKALSDYLKYTASGNTLQAEAAKERIVAAAEGIKEERLQTLESYVTELTNLRNHAASIGGIYDVKNEKVLNREQVFGVRMIGYAKAFGKSIIAAVFAIGNGMWISFKGWFEKILEGGKSVFKGILDAANAAGSGDFGSAASSLAGIFIGDDSVTAAAAKVQQKVLDEQIGNVKTFLSEIETINQEAEDTVKNRASFDVDAARQAILDETANLVTDAEAAANRVKDSMADSVGGSDGAAGATKKLQDAVEAAGDELADLGVFAIRDGGKIVDTFNTAEKGIEKLKKAMTDLNNDQIDFNDNVTTTRTSIEALLEGTVEDTLSVADSYDDLEDYIKDVQSAVKDLAKEHTDFIADAQKGLDAYADKVVEVNKKFDKIVSDASTSTADSLGQQFSDSIERRAEIEKEIAQAKSDLNTARYDNDIKTVENLTEQITKLEEEDKALQGVQSTINTMRTDATGIASDLATVNAQLADLSGKTDTASLAKVVDLERQRLLLLGEQQIATENQAELEKAIADARFTENLSDAEKAAFELGQTLDEAAKSRAAELVTLEEMKKVQEAITAGTISSFDSSTLTSTDAQDLAAKAVLEEQTYRANLERQLVILQEAQAKEVEVYAAKALAIQEQQTFLEQFLVGSYDRIISKLNAVAEAARQALAAQNAVRGGSGGSAPASAGAGFASGGYTGGGSIKDVAGVVHKGEWVAPSWMVKSLPGIFRQLEGVRNGRMKGFEKGGPVGGGAPTFNQPITINAQVAGSSDWGSVSQRLSWELRSAR